MRGTGALAIALSTLAAAGLHAQEPLTARAELIDARGQRVGEATLVETPGSGVWIRLAAAGLPPGTHALHIHRTGRCEPPAFASAGSHHARRRRPHGFLNPDGPHAGDLLNLHVPESGGLETEQLATRVTLRPGAPGSLFDADGSTLVLHAGADDYRSQPAGGAGTPIACGVIAR